MDRQVYKYTFDDEVLLEEVESTMDLALLGAEGIHGAASMHLDARFVIDHEKRAFVIDATTAVGQSLNQLFTCYVRQEVGDGAFRVERVDRLPVVAPAGAVT